MNELTKAKNDTCPFCTEIAERIVDETDLFVIIKKRDSEGYLVITKAHRVDMSELSREEWADLQGAIENTAKLLGAPSYRVWINTQAPLQTVFHFHAHVVPQGAVTWGRD